MPKNEKKGKGKGTKAAPVETDADFDAMLTEVVANDPRTLTAMTSTTLTTINHNRISKSGTSAMDNVWEERIVKAMRRGDMNQMRRLGAT
jgi:hypothetical protein